MKIEITYDNGLVSTTELPNKDSRQTVIIDYTNWRGERRERRVIPQYSIYGSNQWHPGNQWLWVMWDLEENKEKCFAASGIHSWRAAFMVPQPKTK